MSDLEDGAIIALSKLVEGVDLVQRDGKAGACGKVDSTAVDDGLVLEIEGAPLRINDV